MSRKPANKVAVKEQTLESRPASIGRTAQGLATCAFHFILNYIHSFTHRRVVRYQKFAAILGIGEL